MADTGICIMSACVRQTSTYLHFQSEARERHGKKERKKTERGEKRKEIFSGSGEQKWGEDNDFFSIIATYCPELEKINQ